MKDKRRISVVIATYNGETFLNKQIDSIIEQTIVPDEIIIVDDKSTDNTIKILNTYADKHDYVKIFQNQKRLGPIKNFEKSLRISTGEIIFFSDQDDIWDKHKIEKMISCDKISDLLYSDANIIDENDNLIYESEIANLRSGKSIIGNNFLYFIESNCISGHNIMISRRLANSITKFPDATMYDQFLSFACALQYRIDYIDEKLCSHRIHRTNFINNSRFLDTSQKNTKKNKFKSKKARFEQKKERRRELFLNIKSKKIIENNSYLLAEHYSNYKKIFFDFRLFKYLLLRKEEIYPGLSSFKQLIRILRFCKGSKGYWLPI